MFYNFVKKRCFKRKKKPLMEIVNCWQNCKIISQSLHFYGRIPDY